jgi:hypothetical protein
MADHRIQGVDDLVGEGPGRSPQEAVEHRGDDAIASVLRHRLDGSPGNLVWSQSFGIASDELPHAGAGRC